MADEEMERLANRLRAERPLMPEEKRVEVTRTGDSIVLKANALASAINTSAQRETWLRPIAICGPWGSGKTSFLNQVIAKLKVLGWDELDGRPLSPLGSKNGCILRFDPWVFGDRDSLVAAFFRLLIERYPDPNMAILLSRYAESLSIVLSEVGARIKKDKRSGVAVRYGAHLLGKTAATEDSPTLQGLSCLRERIVECLSKPDSRPTLVVIDNVDRLCDEEIGYMFRFLGAVVDFPKTVHLLAYDDAVVSNALESLQRVSGKCYHDKVVSLRIPLPQVDMIGIVDWLFPEELKSLPEDGRYLFSKRLAALVGTPRDANKLDVFVQARRSLSEPFLFRGGPGELLDAYLRQNYPSIANRLEVFDTEGMESVLKLFEDSWLTLAATSPDSERAKSGKTIIAKLLGWNVDLVVDRFRECRNSEDQVDHSRNVKLSSWEKPWLVLRTISALDLHFSHEKVEPELHFNMRSKAEHGCDGDYSFDGTSRKDSKQQDEAALQLENVQDNKLLYMD